MSRCVLRSPYIHSTDHGAAQSLIAQGTEFPLRKPPGFHYDFFLLGITTFIAGLLGLPAPNGLIPQAPIHTTSLVVMGPANSKKQDIESPAPACVDGAGEKASRGEDEGPLDGIGAREADATNTVLGYSDRKEVPVAVVEQRVSNLCQGAMCLVLLTGPFLHVLHLIPQGVIAGLLCVILSYLFLVTEAETDHGYLAGSWAATPFNPMPSL